MISAAIEVTPVILCGGSGTRLWPLSRAGFPKQCLCLTGDESLFPLAAKRLAGLGAPDIAVAAPTIVSGEEHLLAAQQLREAGISQAQPYLSQWGATRLQPSHLPRWPRQSRAPTLCWSSSC